MTMMADGNPYEYVSIRGRLIGDTQEGADDDINMLAKKYIDADEYPFRQPGEVRVTFTPNPRRSTTSSRLAAEPGRVGLARIFPV